MPRQLTYKDLSQLEDRHTLWSRKRTLFNSQFEDVRYFVRPNVRHFHSNQHTDGQRTTDNIFDSTATWANEQLAGGLQGNMFPADERWFELTPLDKRVEDLSFESQSILQSWADEIYFELYKPIANFNGSSHEIFLDLGGFGTGVNYMGYSSKNQSMFFQAIPLGQCTLMENNEGMIDALDRDWWWPKRKIIQEFGEKNIPEYIMKDTANDKEYQIIHSVFPRDERDPHLRDAFNKPWASVHWIKNEKGKANMHDRPPILRQGGFDYFPYLSPRWSKLSGEIYGRSPAMNAMPDIRLLNLMMKEFISAAQLNVRAPIIVEEDGFLPPVDYLPGALY